MLYLIRSQPMMHHKGHDNPTFVGDTSYTLPGESRRNITEFYPGKYNSTPFVKIPPPSATHIQVQDANEKPSRLDITKPAKQQQPPNEKMPEAEPQRDSWGKGIEFLLSCIAMSVGLGNIWR